jgi:hypothetical protein
MSYVEWCPASRIFSSLLLTLTCPLLLTVRLKVTTSPTQLALSFRSILPLIALSVTSLHVSSIIASLRFFNTWLDATTETCAFRTAASRSLYLYFIFIFVILRIRMHPLSENTYLLHFISLLSSSFLLFFLTHN